jgi:hypothetical protein
MIENLILAEVFHHKFLSRPDPRPDSRVSPVRESCIFEYEYLSESKKLDSNWLIARKQGTRFSHLMGNNEW